MIVQNQRKRKATGGRYKSTKPKRLAQRGNLPALTKVGEKKVVTKNTRSGDSKKVLLSHNKANVKDPSSKKRFVADIISVLENNASRHFVRRNIITKGAVIETSKGKAKVTNRPGQEGVVNAVLIK